MKPVFQTDRLNVYRCRWRAPDDPHAFFLALKRGAAFRVAVQAAVNLAPVGGGSPYIGWIETSAALRRQGFAEELWRGLERYLGTKVFGSGVSKAGRALCRKMRREMSTNV